MPQTCYLTADSALLPYPRHAMASYVFELDHRATMYLVGVTSRSMSLPKLPHAHTGSSAFLLPPPTRFRICRIYGPTTGMFPAKPPMVAKKSPKSTNIPYSSTKNPTRGHRSKISRIPEANAAVPLTFCLLAKKSAVFWRPMIRVSPSINKI